jgi:hypothetical protein
MSTADQAAGIDALIAERFEHVIRAETDKMMRAKLAEVEAAVRAKMGAVVTEYGQIRKSGDAVVWDTEPYIEEVRPLAKRIENTLRMGGEVYRRRVIVVEDWTEVDEP